MNKEIIISTCSGCLFYDHQYYHYSDECTLLKDLSDMGKKCDLNRTCHGKIQPDCPLEDSDKITTEERLGKTGMR